MDGRKREEKAIPSSFCLSPLFQKVSFDTFPVEELIEGGCGVPRAALLGQGSRCGPRGSVGGLAGSVSVLAEESKSLRLSEQSEEAWNRRTLGAAI